MGAKGHMPYSDEDAYYQEPSSEWTADDEEQYNREVNRSVIHGDEYP